MRQLGLILVCLTMAACSRNPFWVMAPDPVGDAEILDLPDRAGIVVLPVAGLSSGQSGAVTERLVNALQGANVPAESGSGVGNRQSHFLSAVITANPAGDDIMAVEIDWDLLDAGGETTGSGQISRAIGLADWRRSAPEALSLLLTPAAAEIAALVQEDVGIAVTVAPRVDIAGLEGAPGDGGSSVPRQLAGLLRRGGYVIAPGDPGAYRVTGTYAARVGAGGSEAVAIRWQVGAPDGAELGVVDQNNMIPEGALEGAWGDIAFAIAAGAAEGIDALLQADTRARAESRR